MAFPLVFATVPFGSFWGVGVMRMIGLIVASISSEIGGTDFLTHQSHKRLKAWKPL